jgi:hypothetical protein
LIVASMRDLCGDETKGEATAFEVQRSAAAMTGFAPPSWDL